MLKVPDFNMHMLHVAPQTDWCAVVVECYTFLPLQNLHCFLAVQLFDVHYLRMLAQVSSARMHSVALVLALQLAMHSMLYCTTCMDESYIHAMRS